MSGSTRSWLEGTLDVISGKSPRPSTPVNPVVVTATTTTTTTTVGGSGSSVGSINNNNSVGSHHNNSNNSSSNNNNTANNNNIGDGGTTGTNNHNSNTTTTGRSSIFTTLSAPNSPARGYNSDTGSIVSFPEILRLPSQDSVDRSIHNDSGGQHGIMIGGHGSSTAQQKMIRELRQSNARLTARTAALEADFMNQLNESTRQFEEKYKRMEDKIKEKHAALLKAEYKIKLDTQKIQEQDDTIQRLKEESAFHRHSISDLKTQLREAQQEAVTATAAAAMVVGNPQDDPGGNSSSSTTSASTNMKSSLQQQQQQRRQQQRKGSRHNNNKNNENNHDVVVQQQHQQQQHIMQARDDMSFPDRQRLLDHIQELEAENTQLRFLVPSADEVLMAASGTGTGRW